MVKLKSYNKIGEWRFVMQRDYGAASFLRPVLVIYTATLRASFNSD